MQNHTQMISKSSYLVLVHGITDLINMSTGFFFFFLFVVNFVIHWNETAMGLQTLQTQACQSQAVFTDWMGIPLLSFLYHKSH